MSEEPFRLEFGVTTPPKDLSAQERRTIRQRQLIARGVHPLMGVPLANNGERCGTCAHAGWKRRGRKWLKCDLYNTSGAATDIRLKWPACVKWAKMPPDAT